VTSCVTAQGNLWQLVLISVEKLLLLISPDHNVLHGQIKS
jgi:hypothetical protein